VAMTTLANDEVLRARLGAAGREHAQSFSWQAITQQYLDCYEKAVERHAERGRHTGGVVARMFA
ncbi:MAG: hypothetical protein ACREIT_08045, partial [Tepidisphaeraceae bacterium]